MALPPSNAPLAWCSARAPRQSYAMEELVRPSWMAAMAYHSNTAESSFSILKRGAMGTYHQSWASGYQRANRHG